MGEENFKNCIKRKDGTLICCDDEKKNINIVTTRQVALTEIEPEEMIALLEKIQTSSKDKNK